MCWTPAINPTQSRVERSIFVSDNSLSEFHCTFKLNINISQVSLLEISTLLKCFASTSNCIKMRLVAAGSARTCCGSLQRSPDTLPGLNGKESEGGQEGGKKKGDEGKGKDPQCLKCVDAPIVAFLV